MSGLASDNDGHFVTILYFHFVSGNIIFDVRITEEDSWVELVVVAAMQCCSEILDSRYPTDKTRESHPL